MAEPIPLPRAAPPHFTEHKFEIDAGAELTVRIWPADPPVSKPAPFVTWTHGGAWLAGNHYSPLAWMQPGFRERGYHLLSHNYRLGPQSNFDDQLADCVAAIAWCRANLPRILGKDKVDVDRYVVCGESAGGHLATLMAHYLSPPPRAVIDAYGPVDLVTSLPILGDLSGKDEPRWEGNFSEQELDALLHDRNPANQLMDSLFWDEDIRLSEEIVSECWSTDFKFTSRLHLQGELHRWRSDVPARWSALRRSILYGSAHKERFSDDQALWDYLISISPLYILEKKTSYPPTAFLHGTGDVAVPLSQSQAMAERLKEMGVPVVECYEPDEPHVFDNKYTSSDVDGWDTYIQPILDFCNHHVGHKPE